MNITRRWKRGLAVGCSHGNLADPKAIKAVLDFKKEWKPETILHLGDAFDMTAFRRGASPSELSANIAKDLKAGVEFLTQLEPCVIFKGNHEDRIDILSRDPNAIIAHAAKDCRNAMEGIADALHARIIPYDIDTGWLGFGDTLFGHGYMYNETAIRDHAELVGNCVIAHLHRVGQERGRRRGGATGRCIGMLANPRKMKYAKTNKSKTKWSQGWGFFEYTDRKTVIWLVEKTAGEFRTPL